MKSSLAVLLRLFVVPLTFFLASPVGAQDKPPAKPDDKKPVDARRAALAQAGYTHVPLTLDPRTLRFVVDGAVGPEKTRFLLNSGFRETILDLKLAKQLKLELGEEVKLGELVGRPTEVPGLMIGPYDTRKDWPEAAVHAADLSGWPGAPGGVLGAELLDPYAAVIDFPGRALYLRPTLATAWPRLAGTWEVTSWQEDGAARKLDPKATPTLTFADRRLKLTDGGTTREFAIRFGPNDEGDFLMLIDPKQDGDPDPVPLASGLIKVAGGRMTACLALDIKKSKEPPAEFAAPKGSGYVLLELKHTAPDTKPLADPLRDLLLKDGYTAVRLDRDPDGKRMVAARVGRHDLRLLVNTEAAMSTFDPAGLDKWGAERQGGQVSGALGSKVKGEEVSLRALTLGGYDTRRAWSQVYGQVFDLAGVNKALAELKRQPLDGVLGCLDLRNGSAVIDFGTNTLYLRPARETVAPQLEGKWVGVRYEFDGQKGQYAPGDGTVEFKGGRVLFTTKGGTTEWGFHLRDVGDRYQFGLFDPKADELAEGFAYSGAGLLKLADGTLTLVMEQGQTRKNPSEFAAPKGSELLLVEYERAK